MRLAPFLLAPALLLGQSQQTAPEKATFEGQVFNATTGEPVRKVQLVLRLNVAAAGSPGEAPRSPQQQGQAPRPANPPITATSDLTGKFLFEHVDPGNYQLTARRDGYVNAQFGVKNGAASQDAVILGPGDRKTGFQIKLTPYGAVSGRIAEEDGDPIRNLQVGAMQYRYTSKGRELVENRAATTNDLGEYRIFDLAPGKYYLKVSPRGLRVNQNVEDADAFAITYYPGVQEASNAGGLELTGGQQLTNLNLTLRKMRFATLRGKVIAPQGATGLSIGMMVVTDSGSSSSSNNLDDKDGKFALFGVSPGLVYLLGSYTVAGQRYQSQMPLQVGSSDISGIELRPMPPMEVTGKVRIDGTTDVQLTQLQLSLQAPNRNYTPETGAVKEDGGLVFRNVDQNVYRMNPNRLRTLYLKSVHWGTTDITDSELDLMNGVPANTELAIVLGSDGGTIEGAVKNEKEEPVDAATVTLVPTGTHRSRPFYKTATTNAAGHFTIGGIAPGSYKLFGWDSVNPNAVMFDPDFLQPYDSAAQKVEVVPNDKRSFDLKLIINKQTQ
jgi:hypothetical protein